MGFFVDCVFPVQEKLTPDQVRDIAERRTEDLRRIGEAINPKEHAHAYNKLLDHEEVRLKSVEGRLASVLGLTSITATLLVSGMMALANGALGDTSKIVRGIAAGCMLYLSLQIICATLAAVRGLGRTTWLRVDVSDFVEPPAQASVTTARNRATPSCQRYHSTDEAINFKVTQMAIAHTAIRNFAVGSVIIAVLGMFVVLLQTPGDSAAKAIKKDIEIQRLLRGPQGPSGPPGPPGAPGPFAPQVPSTGQVSNGLVVGAPPKLRKAPH
jgi:hypothetical protein